MTPLESKRKTKIKDKLSLSLSLNLNLNLNSLEGFLFSPFNRSSLALAHPLSFSFSTREHSVSFVSKHSWLGEPNSHVFGVNMQMTFKIYVSLDLVVELLVDEVPLDVRLVWLICTRYNEMQRLD